MGVRFFWLRDRIRRGHFAVKHLGGRWNISDFFTKSLLKDKSEHFPPYAVVNPDREPPAQQQKRTTVTMVKTPL
jgi:hypothetical protein